MKSCQNKIIAQVNKVSNSKESLAAAPINGTGYHFYLFGLVLGPNPDWDWIRKVRKGGLYPK